MAQNLEQTQGAQRLELESVIGFSGEVPCGLVLHPNQEDVLFPLGSTVVIKNLRNPRDQEFLQGPRDTVSAVAISRSGRYVATGHSTHMGFVADVVVWDFQSRTIVNKFSLHKVQVASLSFSPNEDYLASLGGRDDNLVIIWDLNTGKAVCKAVAANEYANCVSFLNHANTTMITGGKDNLSIWEFDQENRKLIKNPCQLGKNTRTILSMAIDADDETVYCGTLSGDVMRISIRNNKFLGSGPKARLACGISSLALTHSGDILVGSGDGTIALLRKANLRNVRQTKVDGGITTLALNSLPNGESDFFFVGTKLDNIYGVGLDDFEAELKNSCHEKKINQIVFPRNYSALFATCAGEQIRVWNSISSAELLRIRVPGLECSCCHIMADGASIVSGWSDGRIRAFGPQSGKLLYTIQNAHKEGVTAISGTSDSTRIISGGESGTVRVWELGHDSQTMIASMKEHRGRVNDIAVRDNDMEAISASNDGSCVVWDLERFARSASMLASTYFKAVVYFPDASQMLTAGTDRKISYWDAFDGNSIRELEGSATAEINAIDITNDGEHFVSGGGDSLLKLWSYDEGFIKYVGVGHSGAITSVKFSPDQKYIVSTGSESGIFIWRNPMATDNVVRE
eukprot:TRINITY_DN525_c0_g1_i2.p1 TRINITY_DN525_c0_g1~~TRINITY_DN525_c0_g1_i2.p1  ORF type:complete len:628 (+),score=192.17 TRINITY_DN525_c0_g1_i2:410-2293(+)